MTELIRALFGPLLWAFHSSLLYAIHTGLCLVKIPISTRAHAMLAASALLTFGVLVLLAWLFSANLRIAFRQQRQTEQKNSAFLAEASLMLVVLSVAGVIWAGAAAGLIDACKPLR